MIKSLFAIISVLLLTSVFVVSQDALALEQKQATDKKYYKSTSGAKLEELQTTKIAQTKFSLKQDAFVSQKDWFFSILLPDNWSEKSSFPFSFASAQTDGNHILVDYAPIEKRFASRDDFHSYLKSTEFLTNSGFGLGNSITTMDTNYGYKTIIELKLTKQDGSQMMIRKDFHFMNKLGKMYSVHGFSSDVDSFKTLKSTLNTFKPLA